MKNNSNKILISALFALTTASVFLWHSNQPSEEAQQSSTGTIKANEAELNKTALTEEQTGATLTSSPTLIVANTGLSQQNNTPTTSLLDDLFPKSDSAWAWAKVDLDSLEQEMPDNLYWALGAPTTDAALLEQRKESKAYWDKEYGKVLSNTATEKEIRAYYAQKNAVSTDYIKFSTLLLDRYSTVLPDEAYGLQTLARNLHLAQLEEIPRKLAIALELQKSHEKRRNDWLADKEAFEANLSFEREEAQRALGKI